MQYFRVRNFEKYQHYKKEIDAGDRRLLWIRVYFSLMHDPDFRGLPDAHKYHVIGIFLLAGEMHNCIPHDPDFVGKRIEAKSPIDLKAIGHWIEQCDAVGSGTNGGTATGTTQREREIDREKDTPADAGGVGQGENNGRKKPSPKPRKESTGEFVKLRDHFVATWEKAQGKKYAFLAKDGVACAKVLQAAGTLERAIATVNRYLATNDRFLREGALTLPLLLNRINKFLPIEKAAGKTSGGRWGE